MSPEEAFHPVTDISWCIAEKADILFGLSLPEIRGGRPPRGERPWAQEDIIILPAQQNKILINKKILLAIESKPVGNIVVSMCKEEGATSIVFGTAHEMAHQMEGYNPDIIFCEFSMTPMNGAAFGLFVRKKVVCAAPIIMLVRDHEIDAPAKSGIADPLLSVRIPFSLNDLTAVTKRAMDPKAAGPTGLRFGPRPR